MTDTAPAATFTFDACADADACKAAMRPLLAAGMDWSEVHCGRCGCQGVVRHADLDVPGTAAPTVAEPAPSEPEDAGDADRVPASPKGGRS